MIRWIKEVEIKHKVIVIITHSDIETGNKGRNNKLTFDCDKCGKFKEVDNATQVLLKNVVVHSKLD